MLSKLSTYLFFLLFSLTVFAQDSNNFNYRSPAPYGREAEVEEIFKSLLRSERGHVLLTGKGGTDFQAIIDEVKGKFIVEMKHKGYSPAFNEYNASDLRSIINAAMNAGSTMVPTLITIKGADSLSKINFGIETIVDLLEKKFGHDSPNKIFAKIIFVTDSANSRKLTINEDFSRLTTKVTLKELSSEESIEAFKQNYNRIIKTNHSLYDGISDKAIEYAAQYYSTEHPGIDRTQALRELVEGAAIHKSRTTQSNFKLSEQDIREYLSSKSKQELMPGAKNFDTTFNKMWHELEKVYGGDEGLKYQLKERVYSFFGKRNKKKIESWVLHGAPGAGKTYLGEVIADVFFQGSILKISGAELKSKSDLNKLTGSPPGYVGSEQQRSILTKFISENPSGGVIVIEEADYMNRDIVQFFTNTKTDKKFKDGLGKEWDLSNYILIQNTNIGQDAIIPTDSANVMTWEQYYMRVAQLTETLDINGKEIKIVKEEELGRMQREYIEQIVLGSNPNEDTSQVAQEANKQKRRDRHFFVQSPNEKNLLEVAKIKLNKIVKDLMLDQQVELVISKKSLKKIIDIDNYDFFKGYSYLEEQLERHVSSKFNSLNLREKDILKVQVIDQNIVFTRNDGIIEMSSPLTPPSKPQKTSWAASDKMVYNIRNLAQKMAQSLKGSQKEISIITDIMKKSLINPNAKKTVTVVGTTGNGKTQLAKSLALALFDSEKAMFSITGLNSPNDLNDYFRSSTGLVGSNVETEFERWFKSRQKAGGGVILLDELLSFHGLEGQAKSDKIAVFNDLYRFLDEGKLKIGGKVEDASSFIPIITGNAFQEIFQGLPAGLDGERQADKVIKELTKQKIIEHFAKLGLDAPKVARLGHIFVKGPLKQSIAREIVVLQTKSKLKKLIKASGRNIDLNIQPKILTILAEKLPTSMLGFRNVEQGFEKALEAPITGIMSDIDNIESIIAKLNGRYIDWYVNKKKVALASTYIEDVNIEKKEWIYLDSLPTNAKNVTPDFKSIFEEIRENIGFNRTVVNIHETPGHLLVGAILEGKNPAEFISMIPGDGFLGYVRPKKKKSLMNLSRYFKEMIILEAGHRAVILEGIHAPGGGSPIRTKGKYPTDDLGRIHLEMEGIINNKIFPNYSELHSDETKRFFRLTLQELIQEMTDYILIKNKKTRYINDLLQKLDEDTYLTGEYLDSYFENYFKTYQIDKFNELKEALDFGIEKVLSKRSVKTKMMDKIKFSQKTKLLKEIQEKLTEDINSERNLSCNNLFK